MDIINNFGLALSSLALDNSFVLQSFASEASAPSELTTGLAILLIGYLAILTIATLVLNSPAALIGEAASVTFFTLAVVGIVEPRMFYIVGALHGLTLAATGVFYSG